MIVSSTTEEIQATIAHCDTHFVTGNKGYTRGELTVRFLITGVGMMRMAYHLGTVLGERRYALCINAGIGGAFKGKFNIGDTVNVVEEVAIDLGAEDASGMFLTPNQIGLPEDISTISGLKNPEVSEYLFLPHARGATVNKVLGTQESIRSVTSRFDPDIVSMEGAAFFYSCLKAGVSFLEMRSISNIVTARDKSSWDIPLAIRNLNTELTQMLHFMGG